MMGPRATDEMDGPTTARNRNELWGRVLIDELVRAGVRELVVSPGSRSAPVVLAAAADGRLRIHVHTDERCAAFLALGIGKASGTPAAVVTTSGSAVANLFPAVLEAAHSESPLLLLTADRPPRLRGADANQTIDQVGIFGGNLRLFAELSPADLSELTLRHLRSVTCRAVAAAIGDPGGPVQLNLPFEKPLEPTPVPGDLPVELAEGRTPGSGGRKDGAPWTRILPHRPPPASEAVAEALQALEAARRPVLVAGIVARSRDAGRAVRRAAAALGLPLLADALSGARFPVEGAEIVIREDGDGPGDSPESPSRRDSAGTPIGQPGAYELALREPAVAEALRPDLVLRIGAAATSQPLLEWLADLEGVPHLLVDAGGRWKDHTGSATRLIPADPVCFLDALVAARTGVGGPLEVDPDWGRMWDAVAEATSSAIDTATATSPFEGAVVAAVARSLAVEDVLFISGSMPVRDLDAFVPARQRPLEVYGNRGASGIDGIISTAAGVSLGSERRVVAVVGDLAALHDANGLAALSDPDVRVLLVVINNDGGGIFHMLPVREHEPAFTPLVATPHGRDLAGLAAFHDLAHRRVDLRISTSQAGSGRDGLERLRRELPGALAPAAEGGMESGIIEVRTDREENRGLRDAAVRRIVAAAADAVKANRQR